MKRMSWKAYLRAACTFAAFLSAAAPGAEAMKRVRVVAYINQQSGCQEDTEAFLAGLQKQYPKHVDLEIVDFGGKGKRRWRKDGMSCMGITINGKLKLDVAQKGVRFPVTFAMPVGFNWTHEELGIAVRQAIRGTAKEDTLPPRIESRGIADRTGLFVGGIPVLLLQERERVEAAAKVLQDASRPGLVREDFGLRSAAGKVAVLVKDRVLIDVTREDLSRKRVGADQLAKQWLKAVSAPYPQRTRPFPGKTSPRGGARSGPGSNRR